MASYKAEIEVNKDGKVDKVETLTFRGEDFTYTWESYEEGIRSREKTFGHQIVERFKDIPLEFIDELPYLSVDDDEEEILEFFEFLSQYENELQK